jgi:hypothetical protein
MRVVKDANCASGTEACLSSLSTARVELTATRAASSGGACAVRDAKRTTEDDGKPSEEVAMRNPRAMSDAEGIATSRGLRCRLDAARFRVGVNFGPKSLGSYAALSSSSFRPSGDANKRMCMNEYFMHRALTIGA